MSDTKNNVSIYNEYLKSINDVKRKVRNAQNIKRKALKKDINASEEDIKLIEKKQMKILSQKKKYIIKKEIKKDEKDIN